MCLQFQDSFGKTVGRCREWVSVKDGHACSPRVLRMRYSGYQCVRYCHLCRPHIAVPFLCQSFIQQAVVSCEQPSS